jgi:hypothetical protein
MVFEVAAKRLSMSIWGRNGAKAACSWPRARSMAESAASNLGLYRSPIWMASVKESN